MSKSALHISVATTRAGATVTYRTTGLYRTLTANNVRGALSSAGYPGTGSKAYWEAVLTAVSNDIAAGNGGGT